VQVSTFLEIYILSVAFLSHYPGVFLGINCICFDIISYILFCATLFPYPVLFFFFFLRNLFNCTSFFFSSWQFHFHPRLSIFLHPHFIPHRCRRHYHCLHLSPDNSHACRGCLLNNGCYAIGFDMSARLAYPLFFFLSSHVKGDFFFGREEDWWFDGFGFFCSCRKLQ